MQFFTTGIVSLGRLFQMQNAICRGECSTLQTGKTCCDMKLCTDVHALWKENYNNLKNKLCLRDVFEFGACGVTTQTQQIYNLPRKGHAR